MIARYRLSTMMTVMGLTMVMLVGITAAAWMLSQWRIPSVAVRGATTSGVVAPGVLRPAYVQAVAKDWLYMFYDFNPRTYAERASMVDSIATGALQRQLIAHHHDLAEAIEAGQQTHIAEVTVGDATRHPSGAWFVPFSINLQVWFGATQTTTRTIDGSTTWIEGTGSIPAGSRSVLRCYALSVSAAPPPPSPPLSESQP